VARKRSEKSEAARASSVSSFVVRQQTKPGLWLRLRVMLASYSTSSEHLVLCLSHVIGCEPTNHHPAASTTNDRHRRTLSHSSCSSSQTTHGEDGMLPVKLQSSSTAAERYMDRSASQPAVTPSDGTLESSKMSLYCTTTDLYLAWAGRSDTATDGACYCVPPRNDRLAAHSCEAPDEWSKSYGPRLISYQDNSMQLQQLLNCDSAYDVTSAAHSTHQSNAYSVDVPDRNVYEN